MTELKIAAQCHCWDNPSPSSIFLSFTLLVMALFSYTFADLMVTKENLTQHHNKNKKKEERNILKEWKDSISKKPQMIKAGRTNTKDFLKQFLLSLLMFFIQAIAHNELRAV